MVYTLEEEFQKSIIQSEWISQTVIVHRKLIVMCRINSIVVDWLIFTIVLGMELLGVVILAVVQISLPALLLCLYPF